MSNIANIHQAEKAVIMKWNEYEGWNLEWSGGEYEHFDAKGYTPKGFKCVIEMKFRKQYYYDKLLEKYKFDKLMQINDDIIKIYWINDPKGNYMFWLNKLDIPPIKDMWCPSTSFWNTKKVLKPCYLIPENDASIINPNH